VRAPALDPWPDNESLVLEPVVSETAAAGLDGFDDDETSLEDLERALVAHARVTSPGDANGLAAWLRQNDVRPGKYPSVPTADAWSLYARFCTGAGCVPLAPFEFARAMLATFSKSTARYRRANGRPVQIQCYLVGKRAARRLRTQALECPPGPEDVARFTFGQLQLARAPARARVTGGAP
jgi:hypothetical protein